MAELSDKYTKILSEISSHISNRDERKYVEKKIMELSSIYLELLDRLTKMNSIKMSEIEDNQEKLVEKVATIQDSIDFIKNDIYDYEGYDFEIVCPYCNYEFVTEVADEQKREVECPECHNTIELDWDDSEENKKIENSNKNSNKSLNSKDEDDEF